MYASVALIYGTAMPVMFPIILFCFTCLWVSERLQLCYYYKQPPQYSQTITLTTISVLNTLPLFAIPFVFWEFGNRQIFDNILSRQEG